MKISYDPHKRLETLERRGLDFEDAPLVFDGFAVTIEDLRCDYGESRFITVGYLHKRMVVVVWTPRGEFHHIISMRKANEREQKQYKE